MLGLFRKRVKHPDNAFYGYHYGRTFTNGAADFAFEPATSTPLVVFSGAGKTVRAIQILPPAPLDVRHVRTTTTGLGGIQTGQLALQPLTQGLGEP